MAVKLEGGDKVEFEVSADLNGIVLDFFKEIGYDVIIPDAQSRGIEIELGLLFRSDADTQFHLVLYLLLNFFQFKNIIQHRDHICKAIVYQVYNVLNVHGPFETVADDIAVLVKEPPFGQVFNNIDIECR